jgi:hypothetical protein
MYDMVAPTVGASFNSCHAHFNCNLRAIAMALTQDDFDSYGSDLIGMAQRAAADMVGPELQRLNAENAHLRQMAQRAQTASIQAALNRDVRDWRTTFADPRFSRWLEEQDSYSAATRSQLLRDAVAKGDADRVARIYQGFQREGYAPAAQQARQSRQTGGNIYTRQDIARLYEQHRKGEISDARWAQIEPDIFRALNQGRVAGALSLTDGTTMTRLVR